MTLLFFLFFWTCIGQAIALRRGVYSLTPIKGTSLIKSPFLSGKKVFIAFALYFIAIGLTFITLFILHQKTVVTVTLLSGVQCLAFSLSFGAIFYSLTFSSGSEKIPSLLWKSASPYLATTSWKRDFIKGCLTWLIAFPVASLIGEVTDLLLSSYFHFPPYEQVAVLFLKAASSSSLSLFFALSTLILIVPSLEELLFRAVLQTYFRSTLGPKPAILLSALCFAFAHFAISQHLGNISLLLSLFVLGAYLGLLYEKNRSLWASIGLHFAFNAISAFRIVLYQT